VAVTAAAAASNVAALMPAGRGDGRRGDGRDGGAEPTTLGQRSS